MQEQLCGKGENFHQSIWPYSEYLEPDVSKTDMENSEQATETKSPITPPQVQKDLLLYTIVTAKSIKGAQEKPFFKR